MNDLEARIRASFADPDSPPDTEAGSVGADPPSSRRRLASFAACERSDPASEIVSGRSPASRFWMNSRSRSRNSFSPSSSIWSWLVPGFRVGVSSVG